MKLKHIQENIDMEAKELMIDDWYYDQELEKNRRWQQLQFFEAYGNPTYMSFIHPIRLTPEILEKNGFSFDEIDEGWYREGLSFYAENNGKYWLSGYYNTITIEYVHQFQHALRLCGLNELANNFQV